MSELALIILAVTLVACIGSKVDLRVGNRTGEGHTVQRSWDIGPDVVPGPSPTPCNEPDCK